MTKLLIVESPTKVKTIAKFLAKDIKVVSTVGHFRDLPKSKLGVDLESGFKPEFVIMEGKEKVIREIKKQAKNSDEVLLAPDPDREGEAIAWHVAEELKGARGTKKPIRRVKFHEITRKAIEKALEDPREIDIDLVDAYKARRVLDRLVGYKISPVLWRKVRTGLSAGRVQSVAVKLICEREDEIKSFKPEEYWDLKALFETAADARFHAKLFKIDGKDFKIQSKDEMDGILAELDRKKFTVEAITDKEFTRRASAPFITSSLQQEASRKLGWSGKRTMRVAQTLYEGVDIGGSVEGLITYMRTDSVRISEEGIGQARRVILEHFDKEFLPEKPNFFAGKAKGIVQDAHEAVRPTDAARSPDSISSQLKPDQYKLYRLIWMRFIACQMAPARFRSRTADIASGKYLFRAVDTRNVFPGFLKLYDPRSEMRANGKNDDSNKKNDKLPLPDSLKKGDSLSAVEWEPAQHFTKPPPRYNDASLVKTLEENGIGRPSTYAPIIDTIIARGYIVRENKSFVPTDWAFSVTNLMKEYFKNVIEVEFTAGMESRLDSVAEGKAEWSQVVSDFWVELEKDIDVATNDDKKFKPEPIETEYVCEECGGKMVIRQGRFGKFLGCSNYPKCKNTLPLDENNVPAKKKASQAIMTGEKCPDCGEGDLVVRRNRWGAQFIACSRYPKCKYSGEVQTKCPKCGKELVKRVLPNKRKLYVCVDEDGCGFRVWGRPIFERCPKCNYFLVERSKKGQKEMLRFCSNPECENYGGLD
ncbi:type I DNA topoisomerase [bacterium]|nr:type I DNA topoisomerase [bacterium]